MKTTGRNLNHNCFSPDSYGMYTPEQMYWFGWIATDGNVFDRQEGNSQDVVTLALTDRETVEKFSKFIGNPNITDYIRGGNKKSFYKVSAYSDQMSKDLFNVGIGFNKTHNLKVSDYLAYNKYFWRGAVEGDGCISFHKRSQKYRLVFTSASWKFINQLKSFHDTTSIQTRESKISTKPYYQMSYFCDRARDLIFKLYLGASSEPHIRLDRKYHLYLDMIRN